MKAFKRSGARWFTRSKPELIEEWRDAPVIAELIALSIEHCKLEPVGNDLHAIPTHYTVGSGRLLAELRGWGAVPRCRSEAHHGDSMVPCELTAQHAGDHMQDRLRWARSEPPWAELRGSKLDRYRDGFWDLLLARTAGIHMCDDDQRSADLNALWWQMSPAEQLDFELWWAERLISNTRRQQGRGILRELP